MKNIIFWMLRLVVAVILLQTLRFKFCALPESVYIFSTLGMEPWGRIGSGIVELIASVLILIPRTTGWGALLAAGTMAGALFFHLTRIGIEVQGDGGQLFCMALTVLIAAVILLFAHRRQLMRVAETN